MLVVSIGDVAARKRATLSAMAFGKSIGIIIVHRVFSGVLGLVLAVAGLAAGSYMETDFKGGTLLSDVMGYSFQVYSC